MKWIKTKEEYKFSVNGFDCFVYKSFSTWRYAIYGPYCTIENANRVHGHKRGDNFRNPKNAKEAVKNMLTKLGVL